VGSPSYSAQTDEILTYRDRRTNRPAPFLPSPPHSLISSGQINWIIFLKRWNLLLAGNRPHHLGHAPIVNQSESRTLHRYIRLLPHTQLSAHLPHKVPRALFPARLLCFALSNRNILPRLQHQTYIKPTTTLPWLGTSASSHRVHVWYSFIFQLWSTLIFLTKIGRGNVNIFWLSTLIFSTLVTWPKYSL
jgi:hypothetical protein